MIVHTVSCFILFFNFFCLFVWSCLIFSLLVLISLRFITVHRVTGLTMVIWVVKFSSKVNFLSQKSMEFFLMFFHVFVKGVFWITLIFCDALFFCGIGTKSSVQCALPIQDSTPTLNYLNYFMDTSKKDRIFLSLFYFSKNLAMFSFVLLSRLQANHCWMYKKMTMFKKIQTPWIIRLVSVSKHLGVFDTSGT